LEKLFIEKIKKGDSNAFEVLIKTYERKLFGYIIKMVKIREDAEDIFQETAIKVWRGITNYDEKQKFSSWLFTIAHNGIIDYFRKNKIRFNSTDEMVLRDNNQLSQQNILEKNEEKEIVQKIVQSLPGKQREVFLLRLNGMMTFKEISELMDEPLNTVLSHMNYAVKKIRKNAGKSYAQ